MSNFTITNSSNPSQSYTFGTRGRKPDWVTAGLADGSIKLPEGYLTAKEKLAKIDPDADPNAPKKVKTVNPDKMIERLTKKLRDARNLQSVQQRHVDDAKSKLETATQEVASIQAELDALVKAEIDAAQVKLTKVQGVAAEIAAEPAKTEVEAVQAESQELVTA